MISDDFPYSSHECSVNCRTLSVRSAFLKNKFAKYHHFLSLSILFLSIEDETIPPPFVGYILSKYFRDSFKKFYKIENGKKNQINQMPFNTIAIRTKCQSFSIETQMAGYSPESLLVQQQWPANQNHAISMRNA